MKCHIVLLYSWDPEVELIMSKKSSSLVPFQIMEEPMGRECLK